MSHANHIAAIDRACRQMDSADNAPDLATLARDAGLSPGHFQRLFKAAVGVSPKAYAMARRRERLGKALHAASSVTDAIYGAGYQGSSGAYRDSQSLGMAPRKLRRGGTGELIRYATASTSMGPILVAATQRGICLVEFGNDRQLLPALHARFGQARIEPADARLRGWIRKVVALVDEGGADPALPLDIRGTAFQTQVWRALTRLARGETVSYGELARRLGKPQGARAVASACASNAIAVLVPCHRVVGADGALTGYKWGIERKRRLLANEQAAPGRRQVVR
jgi:AraC family transcriptional regulator of adaptative response/methylated-DNA-[protein]-cysteine methyltransferase